MNILTGIGECIPKKATEVTENKKELLKVSTIKTIKKE